MLETDFESVVKQLSLLDLTKVKNKNTEKWTRLLIQKL